MRSQSSILESDVSGLPHADAIRSHLERIIGSQEFIPTPKLARFLTFVVETALSGHGDQIKESLVAVEVYGRRPDYNPQIDSTVRVEAGRLRARLRQYYEGSGRTESIRIDIPKGSYAPVFEQQPDLRASVAPEPPPSEPVATGSPRPRRLYARIGITVLIVTCLSLLPNSRTSANGAVPLDSVAVLPFVSLSDPSSTERFCEGLTDEVTTGLARNGSLRVPARTVMIQYKRQPVNLAQIGKDHGVRTVLEGSVRRTGERLIVSAQLIDTRNGYHLWAERYERDVNDLSSVQTEIASKIVAGLGELVRADSAIARRGSDVDPKTLELYHRAHDLLRIPVLKDGVPETLPKSITESVRLFEEVARLSPGFAKGWAGLAEASEWEYEMRGNRPPEKLTIARAAARKAIELEPNLVEGWTVLTSILFFRDWDIPGAEAACRRTIELDPRNTAARQRYIDLLRIQGRDSEARLEIDRAIEMQPATAGFRVRRAIMLYQAGDYEGALKEAQASAGLTNQMPHYPISLWVQGLSLQQKRDFAEAEKVFRKSLAFQPHDPWNEPALGHLLALTGRKAEAESILAELRSQLARGRMTHVAMAVVHTALGRHGDALTALEQGLAAREDSILFVTLDPRLRPLHSQPRFQDIVGRIKGATA